jgi:hypothetical protein
VPWFVSEEYDKFVGAPDDDSRAKWASRIDRILRVRAAEAKDCVLLDTYEESY